MLVFNKIEILKYNDELTDATGRKRYIMENTKKIVELSLVQLSENNDLWGWEFADRYIDDQKNDYCKFSGISETKSFYIPDGFIVAKNYADESVFTKNGYSFSLGAANENPYINADTGMVFLKPVK